MFCFRSYLIHIFRSYSENDKHASLSSAGGCLDTNYYAWDLSKEMTRHSFEFFYSVFSLDYARIYFPDRYIRKNLAGEQSPLFKFNIRVEFQFVK